MVIRVVSQSHVIWVTCKLAHEFNQLLCIEGSSIWCELFTIPEHQLRHLADHLRRMVRMARIGE